MFRTITPMLAAGLVLGMSSPLLADDTNESTAPIRGSAWHNAQQAALAERTYQDGWRWIEGGLLWRRTDGNGSGPHPKVSDTVTLHYAGTFIDGSGFDSSYERGQPATFPLAALIPAWQLAVPQMGVGDTIEIAAPAGIAYGVKGKGPIPGGATLLFTIELLGIQGQ